MIYTIVIRNRQGHKTEIGTFSEQRATALAKKWLQANPFSRAQVVRPGYEARRRTQAWGPLVDSQPYGEGVK